MNANSDDLWKVSIFGGPPVLLTDLPGTMGGASWGTDDMIVFGTRAGGLFRVAGGGGEPEPLTTLDPDQGEVGHIYPHIIEGQDAVVFVIAQTGASPLAGGQLAVLDLRSGDVKRLGLTGASPRYIPTGHLVYAAEDGSIRAVAFDAGRREVTGSPVPLVEGVAVKNQGAANFDVSRDGRLVYFRGGAINEQRALVWVDRSLREEPINAPLRTYVYPRISPDGGRVVLDVRGEQQDIWIWDFASETSTRLILGEGAYYYYPIWTPDGERIAYSTDTGDIYWKASNNTGVPQLLAGEVGGLGEGRSPGPYFFTPDGSALVFRDQANPETNDDLAMISLDADLQDGWRLNDDYRERNAELSPNGQWMAYQSDESGQFQIYVRPFPDVDRDQTTISNNGGTHPLWSRDGRELFYLEPGAGNPRLMSVSVEADDTSGVFPFGERQVVMEWPYYSTAEGRAYDVSLEGERFLAIKSLGDDGEGASSTEITVIVGWQEVVRQRTGSN